MKLPSSWEMQKELEACAKALLESLRNEEVRREERSQAALLEVRQREAEIQALMRKSREDTCKYFGFVSTDE